MAISRQQFIVISSSLLNAQTLTLKTMNKALNGKRFIISCFLLIALLCTLASINEIRLENFLEFGRCVALSGKTLDSSLQNLNLAENSSVISNSSSNSSSSEDEIRVLIGILTLPDQYHKRHFLRLIYGSQSTENARVDVKFIFCNLTKDEQKVMVALEIMRFDDIIILNCTENMNSGKTYTYFSSLPEMMNGTNDTNGGGVSPPYHYVMKADDDTYFRLENLVQALRPLSREDLYFGFVVPCSSMDPFKHYMAGMGYLVSWDIVEWIRESDIPANHLQGPEDKVFGEWLRDGRRGQNRYNAKWSMYNFPQPPTGCTHEFWPDTIAVHNLKTQEKWIQTLNYFNVTLNLKPSKLYHIP